VYNTIPLTPPPCRLQIYDVSTPDDLAVNGHWFSEFLGFRCGVVEVFVLAFCGAVLLGPLFSAFREDDVISQCCEPITS
jgi:hypothetical protein